MHNASSPPYRSIHAIQQVMLLGGVLAREARAWKPLPNGICWRDCFSIDTAHQGGPQRRTARRYSTGLVGLVKMNTDPSSVSGRVVATSSIIVSFELSPWKLRTWRADNRMISMRSKRFGCAAGATGTGRTAGATSTTTFYWVAEADARDGACRGKDIAPGNRRAFRKPSPVSVEIDQRCQRRRSPSERSENRYRHEMLKVPCESSGRAQSASARPVSPSLWRRRRQAFTVVDDLIRHGRQSH